MKGKTLENIVLAVGLLVIGAALFLMYIDRDGVAARSINIIFSIGFIIYIAYSYILSNNLNGEISALTKHVNNLKEEVGRQKATIAKRDAHIAEQQTQITTLNQAHESLKIELENKEQALEKAYKHIAELEASKEG
jgi:peptidoglycan hydrolase CwlO-like protein